MEDATYEKLKTDFRGKMKERVILAPYTTYKVGGPADFFFVASNSDEFVDVIIAARKLRIPFFILGGGSNILVGDGGYRGLVIKNETNAIAIRGMKGVIKGLNRESLIYLEADSGVPMNKLVRFTLDEGLSGLETHLGLPGTVGGAVAMNSKWMESETFVGDRVHQGTILTADNRLKNVDREYFHFSYGKSSLQKSHDILIRVVFALKREEKEALWERANESIRHRRETQPQGVHTAGCVFKNISAAEAMRVGTPDHTRSAGFLLEKSRCKGMKIGNAEVSPLHANFIITHAGATARDVVQLMSAMKNSVREKFGVHLTEEILLIGEFSK